MGQTLRIGLTGGIASGKSTVAGLFAARGAPVIDTDRLAREAVRPGSDGLRAVADAFGAGVLDAEGRLDRAALGRRVFEDPEARQRLEAILHPLVRRRLEARLAGVGAPYAVVVVPLLVETGMHREMDRVVVVDLPEAVQRQRAAARDRLSAAEVEARMAAQAGRAARGAAADELIDNSGARERLPGQVALLHRRFLARHRHPDGEGSV